jgi:hypothetical protein
MLIIRRLPRGRHPADRIDRSILGALGVLFAFTYVMDIDIDDERHHGDRPRPVDRLRLLIVSRFREEFRAIVAQRHPTRTWPGSAATS